MIRGIYTAAAGMMSQQVQQDNVADNLANVSTAGFKHRSASFQEFPTMLLNKMTSEAGETGSIGELSLGSAVHATAINFDQGTLRQTGNPLDLAIEGEGFFAVQRPDGQVGYTRNGQFTLNGEGVLVTREGYLALGPGNSPIAVPTTASRVQIDQNGFISAETEGLRTEVGKVQLYTFSEKKEMQRLGDSVYLPKEGDAPIEAAPGEAGTIQQGFVEQSNVNAVGELIQSMTGLRTYEVLQKNIQMHNQTLQKLVNEVGGR